MLKIIMDSGAEYDVDWDLRDVADELHIDKMLSNGFIAIFSDVLIDPSHISSIEAYDN